MTYAKILVFVVMHLLSIMRSFRTNNFSLIRPTVLRSSSRYDSTISHQRLERILSNRGVGSRTDVAKLFKQGRNISVEIDGELVSGIPLLAAYHKPVGVISSLKDPWGREELSELALEYPFLKTMHPVGRLDSDTSGLLLFSSDGHLTQLLLNPASGVEREYSATVLGLVDGGALTRRLAEGVATTEGTFTARLLSAELCPELVDLGTIKDLPPGLSAADRLPGSRVVLTVTEGKYRMVRRVMHNCGHTVATLQRTRYGQILLGDLAEGEVRACSSSELQWAQGLVEQTPRLAPPVPVPVPSPGSLPRLPRGTAVRKEAVVRGGEERVVRGGEERGVRSRAADRLQLKRRAAGTRTDNDI